MFTFEYARSNQRNQAPINAIRTFVLLLSIVFLLSKPAFAHEISEDFFDYQSAVGDLNTVAVHLIDKKLTNAEVAIIAGVGCAATRIAIRDRYAERLGPFLRAGYPTQEEITKIDIKEFANAEKQVLEKLGATKETLVLAQQAFDQHPTLPGEPPETDGPFVEQIKELERNSCQLRAEPVDAPAEPASTEKDAIGRCIGKAVVGLGVLVTNAVIGTLGIKVITPIGSAVLMTASGGWGWNRVEEGCL